MSELNKEVEKVIDYYCELMGKQADAWMLCKLNDILGQAKELQAEKAELIKALDLALDAACQPYACGEDFVNGTVELLNKLQ